MYIRREASALASEIELDGGRGGAAPGKQERLNELLKEADELYGEAMKGYAKLNVSLKESAEEASHHHELESEEEAAEKGPGLLEKKRWKIRRKWNAETRKYSERDWPLQCFALDSYRTQK